MLRDETLIADLPNLGPQSARWLQAIHVHTLSDLREIGSVSTYQMLKSAGYNVSLNLLYAMHGALHNKSWLAVTAEEKLQLQNLLKNKSL